MILGRIASSIDTPDFSYEKRTFEYKMQLSSEGLAGYKEIHMSWQSWHIVCGTIMKKTVKASSDWATMPQNIIQQKVY